MVTHNHVEFIESLIYSGKRITEEQILERARNQFERMEQPLDERSLTRLVDRLVEFAKIRNLNLLNSHFINEND